MAADYATAADLPIEFATTDADAIADALLFSRPFVSVAWEEEMSTAHALLAAHWLKRHGHGSNRRTIEPTYSRMVGPVSHGPNPSVFAANDLEVSEYGRTYKRMLATRAPEFGLMVV